VSLADDKSLLAMKAARMSEASIANTMGWTETRVRRRLKALEEAAARQLGEVLGRPVEAVSEPRLPRPQRPERAPRPANRVRTPARPGAPHPVQADACLGLVTRTFRTSAAGRGAALLLDDGRIVFTEQVAEDVKPLDEVEAAPAEGCFRMLPKPQAANAAAVAPASEVPRG
jgi:hypothetical protein